MFVRFPSQVVLLYSDGGPASGRENCSRTRPATMSPASSAARNRGCVIGKPQSVYCLTPPPIADVERKERR